MSDDAERGVLPTTMIVVCGGLKRELPSAAPLSPVCSLSSGVARLWPVRRHGCERSLRTWWVMPRMKGPKSAEGHVAHQTLYMVKEWMTCWGAGSPYTDCMVVPLL